ncbi:hypothetical protein [Streptomyces incanus]|uniref:Uncharacterized protein n=1 Tax=Streptomyces incanus TaxID=887453 RepID=A0ABW0Y053_9ACTN
MGAALIMGTVDFGLVPAGFGPADRVPGRTLRRVTGLPGIAALLAFGLFPSGHHLALGMGGIKRVAAYPFLFWVLALGLRGLALVLRRAGRTRASVAEARARGDRVGAGPSGG